MSHGAPRRDPPYFSTAQGFHRYNVTLHVKTHKEGRVPGTQVLARMELCVHERHFGLCCLKGFAVDLQDNKVVHWMNKGHFCVQSERPKEVHLNVSERLWNTMAIREHKALLLRVRPDQRQGGQPTRPKYLFLNLRRWPWPAIGFKRGRGHCYPAGPRTAVSSRESIKFCR